MKTAPSSDGSKRRRSMGLSDIPISNVMVGTAGHIDHGKTELVKLLTGCDTDTLREEKTRGMSIDLGFAPCTLRDDLGVGIVDVPGHEKFIRNMVAGATGIDVLLLVVAADDGVMPQTREHLDIVDLLGISQGMVAVTKIDLVDEETVELAREEVAELLKETSLAGAPIVAVSSLTGQGYDAFWSTLSDVVAGARRKNVEGPFRLPVERVFSVRGYGAVVTGIPLSGRVRVDDQLELLPQRRKVRLRGLQVFGRTQAEGLAGQCIAASLAGVSHDDLQRGSVVASPKVFEPCSAPVGKLRMLTGAPRPLRHRSSVKLLTGTSQVKASVVVLAGERLHAGEEGFVQFLLEGSLVVAPGDPYVVRYASPALTVGGGIVLRAESDRLRRKKQATLEALRRWEKALGTPKALVEECLLASGAVPLEAQQIVKATALSVDQARTAMRSLEGSGIAVAVGTAARGTMVHRSALEQVEVTVTEQLAAYHARQPHIRGMDLAAVRSGTRLGQDVLERALKGLVAAGTARVEGSIVRLTSHQPSLVESDSELARRVEGLYRERAFSTPRPAEAAHQLRSDEKVIDRVVEHLVDQRILVRLGASLYMHRETVEEGERILRDYIKEHGELDSYYYKSLIGSTRRYALALLDHFDAKGITVRYGNVRRLKP